MAKALVLVVDEDGQPRRIKELDEAQEYPEVEFPRALGIAIRTFDAWMLADEQALSSVLNYTVQCQPSPEEIRDPKDVCKQLLAASTTPMSQAGMYEKLSRVLDCSRLEDRCADGFAPFAARVRAL